MTFAAMLLQDQAAPAAPAPSASSESPDNRSTTFQAVQGGPEQHSGSTLLVEAYAVLWVILMAWLFFTWRRQATLGARLDGLERAIDRAASAGASGASGASGTSGKKP
jgi:hypothetical protein